MNIWFTPLIIAAFILIISPFSPSEGQPASVPAIKPPSVDIRAALIVKVPLVEVEYQSESMIVLRGDEGAFVSTNGTMTPFWNAVDIVKHYGYLLNEITTSGMGSQGNPTRFYDIMTKP